MEVGRHDTIQERNISTIIAIDPGPKESAWLILQGGKPTLWGKEENEMLIHRLGAMGRATNDENSMLVVEKIVSYGMAVGEETFETVYWSGRFAQAYGAATIERPSRMRVKMHLCKDSRAKDKNIRQALIDRFGGIATTKKGGPLHGISGDLWAALGLAVTLHDTTRKQEPRTEDET